MLRHNLIQSLFFVAFNSLGTRFFPTTSLHFFLPSFFCTICIRSTTRVLFPRHSSSSAKMTEILQRTTIDTCIHIHHPERVTWSFLAIRLIMGNNTAHSVWPGICFPFPHCSLGLIKSVVALLVDSAADVWIVKSLMNERKWGSPRADK